MKRFILSVCLLALLALPAQASGHVGRAVSINRVNVHNNNFAVHQRTVIHERNVAFAAG